MVKRLADVIDTAIQREIEAFDFYMDMLRRVDDASVKDTIEFIAAEEKKHKAFLIGYRDGNYGPEALRMADVVDFKIAEHLEAPEVKADMNSADIYLVASHRESRSHKFYTQLAALHPKGDIQMMLVKMANEELKHKEKMEYLYSNTAFPQTSGG
jgi:rubrerythrin